MEMIAAGRDCDIFDLGDGTLLRRNRAGLSLDAEADVMRHALAADLLANPSIERATAAGRTLAELHARLHDIPPSTSGSGRLLHLDGSASSARG